jgi:Silencing defective 2 N-terminal ubiquitin domain
MSITRAVAKQKGSKTTTDFGSCRDLSGRRLRHVNDEQILLKWKQAKDSGEEFDTTQGTKSGIDLWFLDIPSWAEGTKKDKRKKFMAPRRKSTLCMDWVRARKNRNAPVGAPLSWGCPRGDRCDVSA